VEDRRNNHKACHSYLYSPYLVAVTFTFPAGSNALFPSAELREIIVSTFETQCRVLCFGPYPGWDEVQARFEMIRSLL